MGDMPNYVHFLLGLWAGVTLTTIITKKGKP